MSKSDLVSAVICFVDRLTSLIAPVTNSNIFFCSLICIGCRVSLKHSHVVESVRRYLVHMYEYIARRNIHTPMRILASTLRELFYIAPPNTAEDRCSIITPTANVVLIMLISSEAFPKLFPTVHDSYMRNTSLELMSSTLRFAFLTIPTAPFVSYFQLIWQ